MLLNPKNREDAVKILIGSCMCIEMFCMSSLLPSLPHIKERKKNFRPVTNSGWHQWSRESVLWHPSSSATGVVFGVGCYIELVYYLDSKVSQCIYHV